MAEQRTPRKEPLDVEASRTEEIEARLDAATPGPWRVSKYDDYIQGPDGENIHWDLEGLGASWGNRADADLIAHAPDDLRYLLAENARLRLVEEQLTAEIASRDGRIHRLRAALEGVRERLTHNTLMQDGEHLGFVGDWVAMPRTDFDAVRQAARAAPADHDCLMPSACGVTGFYCSNAKRPSAAAALNVETFGPPSEDAIQRRCWTISEEGGAVQCERFNGHGGSHSFGAFDR